MRQILTCFSTMVEILAAIRLQIQSVRKFANAVCTQNKVSTYRVSDHFELQLSDCKTKN